MQNIKKELDLKVMCNLPTWKHVIYLIIGLAGLISLQIVISLILQVIGIGIYPNVYDYQTFLDSASTNMILNGVSYLIIASIFIVLIANDFDEITKSFKSWRPFVAAAVGFAAVISFNMFYSSLLSILKVSVSDNANETGLNSIIVTYPIASLVVFAIIGPVVEELTYRVGLFSLLAKFSNILAYVATIIVFTFIHFDFETTSLTNELLNIPYYAFAAFVLCFLYNKFGLAASVASHITNNLMSWLGTIMANLK